MLRLSRSDEEAVRDFQAKHTAAAQCGFGRLLRSPSVWEDIVKCILLCNCGCAAPSPCVAPSLGYVPGTRSLTISSIMLLQLGPDAADE